MATTMTVRLSMETWMHKVCKVRERLLVVLSGEQEDWALSLGFAPSCEPVRNGQQSMARQTMLSVDIPGSRKAASAPLFVRCNIG
jgi:hypothetical protein